MLGIIQELGSTQKGSPKVKIGGTWYYPGKACPTQGLQAGMTVEFETKPFPIGNEGKTLPGLEAWRIPPSTQPPSPAPAVPVKGNGRAPNIDPMHLPCISNVLAHAIDAKAITEPGQIRDWVEATNAALTFPFDDKLEGVPPRLRPTKS